MAKLFKNKRFPPKKNALKIKSDPLSIRSSRPLLICACKPGSVPYTSAGLLSFIYATYPSGWILSETRANDSPCCHEPDLFGLATRKVYPSDTSLYWNVSSYLTFSPLPLPNESAGEVIFCGPLCCTGLNRNTLVFTRCGVLCCPDFPPRAEREAIEQHVAKVPKLSGCGSSL